MSFGVSPVLVPRWPDVASVAQLPNVAGALVQSDGVRVNDLCVVTGMGYFVCTTRTPGAAVWAPLGSVANRASSSSNTLAVLNSIAGNAALQTPNALSALAFHTAPLTAAEILDRARVVLAPGMAP